MLFRRNTKESVRNECRSNVINEHVNLLDFTFQERSIYDSYLQGHNNKYSDFLIQLCCHPELSNATKEIVKNCKTLDEIQTVLLQHNQQTLIKLKGTLSQLTQQIDIVQMQLQQTMTTDESYGSVLKQELTNLKRKYTATLGSIQNTQRTHDYLNTCIQSIKSNEYDQTCPICLETISNMSITKCGHKHCWDCIRESHRIQSANNGNTRCATCNVPISISDVYLVRQIVEQKKDDCNERDSIIENVKSTKIGTIIHFIKSMDKKNKIILFSQWDQLLHKVGDFLQRYNINIVYCSGSVYQKQNAINTFIKDPNTNIIMLSSSHAASGINLTIAHKIILLEPVYGPVEYRRNIENQAIGRADRIGQNNPIDVYRFIIKDTLEEDIINGNIDDKFMKNLIVV
jgi:SNF2 family DNA or RNA helicase